MKKEMIQAIVLAGGFGTRLGPLTSSRPKPLVKVLDKSVLELVLGSLKRADIENITVSTFYKSDMIEKLCDGLDKKIRCVKEGIPLGTAGGVKNCYDGVSDYILVLAADAVFDFDLDAVLDYHFKNNCDVTIAATRKENPTELGAIMCDDRENVVSFVEKPAWKNVKTDLVNTGIYVISKNVINEIPNNMQYDFSKNLFPKLMREGRMLKVLPMDGYWCDIGTIDEYYNCNMTAVKNGIKSAENTQGSKDALLKQGINAEGDVYVSETSNVGKSVRLADSVLCNETAVCDNCDINSSIIGERTNVGNGCSISFSIVGENVSIGENCIIPDGCVIGDNTRISDGTRLKKYTRVSSDLAISKEDKSTMDFSKKMNVFKEDATAVFEKTDANAGLALLAKSIVLLYKRAEGIPVSVGVMCKKNAEFAKHALLSGLQSCITEIYDGEMGKTPLLRRFVKLVGINCGVYLYTENGYVCAKIFDGEGNEIDETLERKIMKIYREIYDDDDDNKSSENDFSGKICVFPALQTYKTYLKNTVQSLLCTKTVNELQVFTKDEILKEALSMLSVNLVDGSTPNSINVDVENESIKMRQTNRVLDTHHVNAIVLKNLSVLSNPRVMLSENAPTILKNMLTKSSEETDIVLDLTDPYISVLSFLCIAGLGDKNYEKLCETIPEFEVFTDEYVADINRASTMEKLSRLYSDTKNTDTDGIRLQMADGNVTVVPNRAKGFKIVAEAVNMETAKELSFKIGEIIKG